MNVVFCITTLLGLATVHLGSSVTCPQPFLALGSGCYYIPSEANLDWIHASAVCSLDFKGYLAEITDEQEQANIAGLIQRTDPANKFYYFIGATDSQKEGNFRWMTSGNYMAYSNWNIGEPNNDQGSQHCVFLHPYSNLCKWDDVGCEERSVFFNSPFKALCEANPIEPLDTCSDTFMKSIENQSCPMQVVCNLGVKLLRLVSELNLPHMKCN